MNVADEDGQQECLGYVQFNNPQAAAAAQKVWPVLYQTTEPPSVAVFVCFAYQPAAGCAVACFSIDSSAGDGRVTGLCAGMLCTLVVQEEGLSVGG